MASESTKHTALTFIKYYATVCLEGTIIVLTYIILSTFAINAPVIDSSVSNISIVWSYISGTIFNMLVLVRTINTSDIIVKEIMGL